MTVYIVLTAVIVVVNIVTFALYTVDKRRAVKGEWRISEYALLLFSVFTGGIGGFAGMFINRHKTRKAYFYFINLQGVLDIFVAYWIAYRFIEIFASI